MATSYKAIEMAKELADELKKRLSAFTVTESFDTDGNPMMTIDDGSPAAGESNVVIKLKPTDWPLAKDILGNASQVYCPTVIMIATEANYAGATDNVLDPVTPATLLAVIGACVTRGARVEWYQSTSGSAPATTDMVAAKLKGSFENLYWPMVSSQ